MECIDEGWMQVNVSFAGLLIRNSISSAVEDKKATAKGP